jgi:signal transduction histidine kinase
MLLAIDQDWFTRDEMPALTWLREACEAHRDTILADAVRIFPAAFAGSAELCEQALISLWDDWLRALSGDVRSVCSRLSAYGANAACAGVELRGLSDAAAMVRQRIVELLIARYAEDHPRLAGALYVMQRLFDRALTIITREYLLYREALMEEQRRKEDRARRHAQALETENLRIQEASRLKSEFLANMSHELRTPLNSIIGFADLLYDGEIEFDSPQHDEFLGDILKSSRHLLKLINDVLDLAKVEAGKMEFRPETISLPDLIGEVTDVLSSLARTGHVELSYEASADVQQVVADPARLSQVLYNYLSNALKFTATGGRVVVRAFAVNSVDFRVEVQDSGIGISAENMGRLFVEFEQLECSGGPQKSGTGLGLALTKRIVEAQGGAVGVSSELDRGSVFWVQLPGLTHNGKVRPQSYFEALRPTGIHVDRSTRGGA